MQLYLVDPDSVLLRRRWFRRRLRRKQWMRFHLDHPSSLLLWRRRWILLLIHAEKTVPRNIKTAVRIFRAAVFWCNRAISCYTKIPPGRLCAPGRRRYITASDSSPAPARPADFLHFPRGRDFCPVFSLRTRRQFHILHCHL